jgi:hypothetical protein
MTPVTIYRVFYRREDEGNTLSQTYYNWRSANDFLERKRDAGFDVWLRTEIDR